MLRVGAASSQCLAVRAANDDAGFASPRLAAPSLSPILNTDRPRKAQGGMPRWRLQRALNHIEQNLNGDIRLQDLADAARLSAHHFSELFRQSTGTSPYRYVLIRRVERAKALLNESMLGVLDIALAVGLSDQSHFSKVFRRVTGITPSAYRTVMWAEGVPPGFPEDQTNVRTNVLTANIAAE